MKSVTGSWEFEDLGGRTRATYSLEVEPAGMLAMALRGSLVDGMPARLKAFAESA